MKRRALVGCAVGAAAAAAGLGWSLRSYNRTSAYGGGPEKAIAPIAADGGAAGPQALWSMSFENPNGGQWALSAFRGAPLLLNFWATWCPPCIKEMPLLDRFERTHRDKGWRVLGLAADNPTAVRDYLQRVPVAFAIGLAGMQGIDLSRSLGNTGGQLPFTVVFDRQGNLTQRKLGVIAEEELAAWASALT